MILYDLSFFFFDFRKMVALNKAYCVCVKPNTFELILSFIEMYVENKDKLKKIKHEHISGRYFELFS